MRKPNLLQALIVVVFILGAFYLMARVVFITTVEYDVIDYLLAWFFFLSEAFIVVHGLGYFFAVYRINRDKKIMIDPKPLTSNWPSVAVLVAARHEPQEVLRQTFQAIKMMDYPNKSIYLLDDSSDEKYLKEADELVEELGIKIFRRKERHGAKAGIINDCTKHLREKYITVFDADQNPIQTFLTKLVPFLERDPKLAFIQTPQFYSNLATSRISMAANMQQTIFYEYVCESKSSGDAMICCGTNVVFRKEALLEIGGLDETSVTEDFSSSAKFHMQGWKSFYHNHVYTFGQGPEDLLSYFKQQDRWASGNVGVLRRLLGELIMKPNALKFSQWCEYAITGSYYLIGWAYLFLMACPVIYVFFNVPCFFLNPKVYMLTYTPFLIFSWSIFYISMGQRNSKISALFKGQLLGFITLPVYALASFRALIGIKGSFQVTGKGGAERMSYFNLWPQILLWAINLAALAWGINRVVYEQSQAIIVNLCWIFYHLILLSGVFYFNEINNEEGIGYPRLDRKVKFDYKLLVNKEKRDSDVSSTNMCFRVKLNDNVAVGDTLMCKVRFPSGESTIFDGWVVWSQRKGRKRYTVGIKPVTITKNNAELLEKNLV